MVVPYLVRIRRAAAISLVAAVCAIGSGTAPADARADTPWGASVLFECTTYGLLNFKVIHYNRYGNEYRYWVHDGSRWQGPTAWSSETRLELAVSRGQRVQLYVQHRRPYGSSYQYHEEWGFVKQNGVGLGYGAFCYV